MSMAWILRIFAVALLVLCLFASKKVKSDYFKIVSVAGVGTSLMILAATFV